MAIDFTLPPEVHTQQIAMHVLEAFRETGSTRRATGTDLP
jgi:hypothetical protein